MDSLFLRTGCNPACTGKADASQFAQGPVKAVQICTCRISPSQQRGVVAFLNNASSTGEATSKSHIPTNSFNPLLLIASHPTIPAPLKFLWISTKGEQDVETGDDAAFRHIQDELQAECDKLLNDTREFIAENTTPGESNVPMESRSETNIANTVNDDDVIAPSMVVNDAFPPSLLEYLMSRLGALLPGLNDFKAQSVATDSLSSPKQLNVSLDNSSAVVGEAGQTSLFPQSMKDEVARSADVAHGCCLEVSYVPVAHTKESFASFLQETSLYDMKVFTQLAFLCDMAYMIPSIQPEQLMKYHRLSLVATSLGKKAELEINVKESETLKKVPARDSEAVIYNTGNGCAISHSEPTLHINETLRGESSMQSFEEHSSSVQSYASTGPDIAQLPERIGTSFLCRTDLSGDQRSPVIIKANDIETRDKDSLLAIASVTAGAVVEEEMNLNLGKDVSSTSTCPCEWFVCDEQHTHTRTFVIQGSESLASWQTNLFFEPSQFEGLDASVHRGIYDAARALYDQVLPEVTDHVSRHGDLARVRFTGHSLGGSLAVLLTLLLQVRGAVPGTGILPVVTFGSPFIMCGGDRLLQTLQLPVNHIQSVIMHRDIVPRAFACDYPDHVAEVLRRLNGRFRDHSCLNHQKLLYPPMGQLYILQPVASAAPPHPFLPDGLGLYALKHPLNGGDSQKAAELRAAQRAFLNLPHPLDILSDPAAYGVDGTVSRNHDPRSYTKAIQVVLKHKLKGLRRMHREHRRQLMWPSLIVPSSSTHHKNKVANASRHSNVTARSVGSAFRQASLVFKQQLTFYETKHLRLLLHSHSLGVSHKDAFGRYARLVTTQRIQAGVLLALSLRIIILKYLSSFSVFV